MRVIASTIPQKDQRYRTVGDYQVESDEATLEEVWRFRITATEDWRSAAAVFLHEFVEAMLTKERGISIAAIDEWDTRKTPLTQHMEPGDMPGCPYGREHRFAENLERLFVAELGLTWAEHEEELERAAKGT